MQGASQERITWQGKGGDAGSVVGGDSHKGSLSQVDIDGGHARREGGMAGEASDGRVFPQWCHLMVHGDLGGQACPPEPSPGWCFNIRMIYEQHGGKGIYKPQSRCTKVPEVTPRLYYK